MCNDEDYSSIWIFGYGSLVWKNNDFKFEEKKQGFIKGYKRRFYQNSIDHRGSQQNPGRVATLIYSDNSDNRVYGMAYKISSQHKKEVLAHLDFREKNGYERCDTLFYPIDNEKESKPTIVYVANDNKSNSSWNNDHDLYSIANQIFYAIGPSGKNITYVYNLCEAMRDLFPQHYHEDKHLFELEIILKKMEKQNSSQQS